MFFLDHVQKVDRKREKRERERRKREENREKREADKIVSSIPVEIISLFSQRTKLWKNANGKEINRESAKY